MRHFKIIGCLAAAMCAFSMTAAVATAAPVALSVKNCSPAQSAARVCPKQLQITVPAGWKTAANTSALSRPGAAPGRTLLYRDAGLCRSFVSLDTPVVYSGTLFDDKTDQQLYEVLRRSFPSVVLVNSWVIADNLNLFVKQNPSASAARNQKALASWRTGGFRATGYHRVQVGNILGLNFASGVEPTDGGSNRNSKKCSRPADLAAAVSALIRDETIVRGSINLSY